MDVDLLLGTEQAAVSINRWSLLMEVDLLLGTEQAAVSINS